jgi:hypothetical protein
VWREISDEQETEIGFAGFDAATIARGFLDQDFEDSWTQQAAWKDFEFARVLEHAGHGG